MNDILPFIVWLSAFFATAAMYVRAAVLVVRSDPRYRDHVVWTPFPQLTGRSKMDPELRDRFYRAVMPWFGVFLLLILILAGAKYWPYAMMSLGWAQGPPALFPSDGPQSSADEGDWLRLRPQFWKLCLDVVNGGPQDGFAHIAG